MKKEIKPEKAFWIYCRECGCEYLEPIEWVTNGGTTECPHCKNKLKVC